MKTLKKKVKKPKQTYECYRQENDVFFIRLFVILNDRINISVMAALKLF